MGKWVRVVGALVIAGRPVEPSAGFNPVQAMATTLDEGYGLDERAARLRAAQIVAAALGWRIFEDYLVEAGGLGDVPLARCATSWPARPAGSARPRGPRRLTRRPRPALNPAAAPSGPSALRPQERAIAANVSSCIHLSLVSAGFARRGASSEGACR